MCGHVEHVIGFAPLLKLPNMTVVVASVRHWGDSKLDVPVRVQYAVALNHYVSLGAVS